MSTTGDAIKPKDALQLAIAALGKDYSKLAHRVEELTHTVTCTCAGITLRVHYPALRQSKATIGELVDAISLYLMHFCLTRSEIAEVRKHHGKIDQDEYELMIAGLVENARALFKEAHKKTNRNGEAGELLLYLLTEWILGAPQLIAKMALKTNPEMAVHGADGVHVRFCDKTGRLYLYWGESKLYKNVNEAISKAVTSVVDALQPNQQKHEIDLVKRYIDLSGFKGAAKEAVLDYLNPFGPGYKNRHDVITALIGFDFDAYEKVAALNAGDAEAQFRVLAEAKLKDLAPIVATAFTKANQANATVEFFFFPMPAVKEFRDLFQEKIGWSK
jgi:hypothetical protein